MATELARFQNHDKNFHENGVVHDHLDFDTTTEFSALQKKAVTTTNNHSGRSSDALISLVRKFNKNLFYEKISQGKIKSNFFYYIKEKIVILYVL